MVPSKFPLPHPKGSYTWRSSGIIDNIIGKIGIYAFLLACLLIILMTAK